MSESSTYQSEFPGEIGSDDVTALIWATALGLMVWGVVPDLEVYFGAVVIIASVIYPIFQQSA